MASKPVVMDVNDPGYPHGTERGYFRGCKCDPCMRGKNREAHLRKLAAMHEGETWDLLALTQTHLLGLLDHGKTGEIARAAGVQWKVVNAILGGLSEGARRKNLRVLLAVRPEQVKAASHWGDLARARQRCGSMAALGYTYGWQTVRLGIKVGDMMTIRKTITAVGAARIEALYAEVGDKPGPSAVSARRAKAAGWHVPGCYDEDGTFLPWAVRQSDEIEERKATIAAVAERRQQVWSLAAKGLGNAEIAERLGCSTDLVETDKRRGLSRVAERLLADEVDAMRRSA